MSLQHLKLADIQYLPSSAGSLYANPTSTKSFIKGLILFNGNSTTETIKLYVVPDSNSSLGTAGESNQIANLSLPSGDTLFFPLNVDGMPVTLTDHNDSIQGQTTTSSKVTCIVIGDIE